jgi:hypothetical protein
MLYFVSFRSVSFRSVSFRFVSFLFRFALYRYPLLTVVSRYNLRTDFNFCTVWYHTIQIKFEFQCDQIIGSKVVTVWRLKICETWRGMKIQGKQLLICYTETKSNETDRNETKRCYISFRFDRFRFVRFRSVSFRFYFVSHFTGTVCVILFQ